MDFQEALEKIRKNNLTNQLLVIPNPKERARALMNLLPGTSSWDQKTIQELFEAVNKERNQHLQAIREFIDVL